MTMTSRMKQRTKSNQLYELQDELDEPYKLDEPYELDELDEPYELIHHPQPPPNYLG